MPRLRILEGPSLYCAAPVVVFEAGWPAPKAARAEDLAEWLQRSLGHGLPAATLAPRGARPAGSVAIRYSDPDVAQLAGRTALDMLDARDRAHSDAILERFHDKARTTRLGETPTAVIAAARERGIPVRRLVGGFPFLILGQGARQKRLRGSVTAATSQLATSLSTRKHVAADFFRAQAIPVPRHRVVSDARSAIRAAGEIGYPVVVKPTSTDRGIAVSVGLENAAEVTQAFERAARHGLVLVQEFVPGNCYRLVVFEGRTVMTIHREPASVLGDGKRTVRALVQAANAVTVDRKKQVALDDELKRVLRRQGTALERVAPAGANVRLRGAANLAIGGTYVDVSAAVHPDNRRLAERVAALTGIDIAGIDMLSPDIGRSYLEGSCKVTEINTDPSFFSPPEQPFLARALIEALFPSGQDGRIPIVCLLADRDVSALAQRIEEALAQGGHLPASASAHALRVGRADVARGDLGQLFACSAALAEVAASAALLVLTSPATCRGGLPFDRCALAIIDAPLADARAAALLRSCAGRVLEAADEAQILRAVRDLPL